MPALRVLLGLCQFCPASGWKRIAWLCYQLLTTTAYPLRVQAGIQWRAKRADVCYRWIPGQARNDGTDTVYMPDQ
jgi:hypothetical protein